MSWTVAAPVDVAPALRTTGTLANIGRARAVADPRALRAYRQRAQAEALTAYDGLRAALVTGGMVRLSAFAGLTADAFAELLALLALGLDTPVDSDGRRRALSIDGRVEVVLRDPADGRLAALRTNQGVLRGPDLLVSISLPGAANATEPREAASG